MGGWGFRREGLGGSVCHWQEKVEDERGRVRREGLGAHPGPVERQRQRGAAVFDR